MFMKITFCVSVCTALLAGACGFDCDFETDLCGWDNNPAAYHSTVTKWPWRRNKGSTPTVGTGPSLDHRNNLLGYYVYSEASAPAVPGDEYILLSPAFSVSSGSQCVSFWYHMNAYTSPQYFGSLDVSVMAACSQSLKDESFRLFTKQGSHGDTWHQQEISIPTNLGQIKLMIRATRGLTYSSDIAIDDIKLMPCSGGLSNINVTLPKCTETTIISDTTTTASTSYQTAEDDTTTPLTTIIELTSMTVSTGDIHVISSVTPSTVTADLGILSVLTDSQPKVDTTTEPEISTFGKTHQVTEPGVAEAEVTDTEVTQPEVTDSHEIERNSTQPSSTFLDETTSALIVHDVTTTLISSTVDAVTENAPTAKTSEVGTMLIYLLKNSTGNVVPNGVNAQYGLTIVPSQDGSAGELRGGSNGSSPPVIGIVLGVILGSLVLLLVVGLAIRHWTKSHKQVSDSSA